MAYYYIKLYHEILDDPKMGKMSDRLFRRTIELFLIAGENGRDGILPSLDDISWKLRIQEHILEQDLAELKDLGIVHYNGLSWVVSNFEKRQAAATDAQRMQEYRKRKRQESPIVTNALRNVTEPVTNSVQELKLNRELKNTLSSDDDENAPKKPKKPNPHDVIRKKAEEEFKRLTNLEPPSSAKEAGKLWWTPLREMCNLASWDAYLVADYLRKTYHHHVTESNLDYSSPASFMKSFRMIAAQQKPTAQAKQEDYSTLTQEQADSLIANYERQGVELNQKEKDDIYARVE